jgi:hypothetical protein
MEVEAKVEVNLRPTVSRLVYKCIIYYIINIKSKSYPVTGLGGL